MHRLPPFDPASLKDVVARSTRWGPNQRGGASFRTHWLQQSDSDVRRFRPTAGALLFYGVFLVLGLGVTVASLGALRDALDDGQGLVACLMGVAFGLLFATVGGWMGWTGTRPIVFHAGRERFWVGWGEPESGQPGVEPLGRVHALQIVSEYCSGRSRFYSYELNLVLVDGRRVTVVDHGHLGALRADAAELARFLRVPLWDPVGP